MAAIALTCKATLAVLLVAAGAAKLADLRGFAATVQLFLPGSAVARPRLGYLAAIAVAAAEIAVGAASLSSPLATWLNVLVLGLCCAFVAVSAVGHARYPGRPC